GVLVGLVTQLRTESDAPLSERLGPSLAVRLMGASLSLIGLALLSKAPEVGARRWLWGLLACGLVATAPGFLGLGLLLLHFLSPGSRRDAVLDGPVALLLAAVVVLGVYAGSWCLAGIARALAQARGRPELASSFAVWVRAGALVPSLALLVLFAHLVLPERDD